MTATERCLMTIPAMSRGKTPSSSTSRFPFIRRLSEEAEEADGKREFLLGITLRYLVRLQSLWLLLLLPLLFLMSIAWFTTIVTTSRSWDRGRGAYNYPTLPFKRTLYVELHPQANAMTHTQHVSKVKFQYQSDQWWMVAACWVSFLRPYHPIFLRCFTVNSTTCLPLKLFHEQSK